MHTKSGTLAPQFTQDFNSIDIIFASYWFPPSKNVRLMAPEVQQCIDRYMDPEEERRLRLDDQNSLFRQLDYDHDAYEEAVKQICSRSENEFQQMKDSQKQNLIKQMGAMTVYRINFKCLPHNSDGNVNTVKEYGDQLWPSYLGINANSVANVNYVRN